MVQCSTLKLSWKGDREGVIVPVVDNTVAVAILSEPGSDRVECNGESYLDGSTHRTRSRRRGHSSPAMLVRRIGRMLYQIDIGQSTRSTSRGRRADGTHVVRKCTTAGTGKGFVGRKTHYERL